MKFEFRTKKLKKCYEESKSAQRELGAVIARKYILRVNTIKVVKSIDDLYGLPGLDFHPLKGDRAGTYSMNLDGFNRLIVSVDDEGLLTIEEVSKHYGD